MQEVDSRNQNFLGGACLQPLPRGTRLWHVVCLWHTAGPWHAKSPPLYKSWDPSLNTIVFCNSDETWAKVESRLDQLVANACGKDLEEAVRKHAGGMYLRDVKRAITKTSPKNAANLTTQSS